MTEPTLEQLYAADGVYPRRHKAVPAGTLPKGELKISQESTASGGGFDRRETRDDFMRRTVEVDGKDVVNRPEHYAKFVIEPITFVMQNNLGFAIGNIIKYACRGGSKLYPGKNAVESEIIDLEKVRRYAEMRINQLKEQDVL